MHLWVDLEEVPGSSSGVLESGSSGKEDEGQGASGEAEGPPANLQIAWEVLELARIIFSRFVRERVGVLDAMAFVLGN